ncbi:MAG: NB-ARC domain-containing protein [Caldilineaceae bacterium]
MSDLRLVIHTALQELFDERSNGAAGKGLTALLLFRQWAQANGKEPEGAPLLFVSSFLPALAAASKTAADVLRLRFIEKRPVLESAGELHLSEAAIYKAQNRGIDRLTDLLCEREVQAHADRRQELLQRLEAPTNSQLLGVDPLLYRLVELLSNPATPGLLALEGIGGIGKTSLAHVVARHLIGLPAYSDFAWVTARRSDLDLGGALRLDQRPALTAEGLLDALLRQLAPADPGLVALRFEQKQAVLERTLKREPHLIVVDNLETVVDLETLLPLLRRLANPSRFLLTARIRLDREPGVYHLPVPPLDEASALLLVRQEAERNQLTQVLQADDAALRPIYATVGGNPLALRLVVGQLHADSLHHLLADLQEARGAPVENLYTHIYRRAYDSLTASERTVWLGLLLLIGPAATAERLADICEAPLPVVRPALQTLARLSLIDCHGDLNSRYFSLHSLTRTFLQKQVVRWTPGNYSALLLSASP